MTEKIIIILSISTIWIFDSVRVIQLDSRRSSQRVNTSLLPLLLFRRRRPHRRHNVSLSVPCSCPCKCREWLLDVSLSLPLPLSRSFIFRYTTHTKDEEMKRPRPGDEMFGPWKEMEFWPVGLLGREDVAFDWFFFSLSPSTPSMSDGLLKQGIKKKILSHQTVSFGDGGASWNGSCCKGWRLSSFLSLTCTRFNLVIISPRLFSPFYDVD